MQANKAKFSFILKGKPWKPTRIQTLGKHREVGQDYSNRTITGWHDRELQQGKDTAGTYREN